MENLSVSLIIEQLKKALDKKTDKDLAEFLDLPKQTISNWKNRNNMPLEKIIEFSQRFNLSLDWLITGESKESKLETAERMLLTAFKDLDDNQKMQAVTFVGNLASGTYSSGQGVNQTAHGNGNNQQVFSGDVGEVVGIRK
ncbi:helix-turn-helix domain-containing protein [Glaesserella parasuis]|uniref:helix-turn-helix domain-containing protein n=1 Tax=Glaesserella parasuis TaxID=738 RepID=UPI0013667907|nr:helix-turn-helix domain-containing protein [Glaesserella parasuis]MDG6355260.1 helix-turn-helix domain-containing protein [Glaesserella parasuis]MDO9747470.1 helix-turn-helix domain-containing protein [Glaesserella parasuis]MDO9771660.1 helix-turn-helix domain-containing protein [Glaesserella parasuis]MDO9773850.1 helix-turn-helix domain-containing protein [Glaesserella parasuis]MDO9803547.1 helix-turn-helix domain-containing protein [Glaesserella parasuis]